MPRAPGEFSDAARSVIVHHMHVRGYLTESDTEAVLAFLRASNGAAMELPPRPHAAGAKLDAAALIAQKGCKGCHVIGGERCIETGPSRPEWACLWAETP